MKSHDGTSGRVLITEGGGVADFGGAGTCEVRNPRVVGVSHVPSRSFLVVNPRRIRVFNDVVRDVRPQLSLLSGAVGDSRHHLGRLHVAGHRHLVGFPLHIYLRNSPHSFHWFLHFSLASFAVHLHFHLHRLMKIKLIKMEKKKKKKQIETTTRSVIWSWSSQEDQVMKEIMKNSWV